MIECVNLAKILSHYSIIALLDCNIAGLSHYSINKMNLHILSLNKNLYSTRRLVEEAQKKGHVVDVLNYERLAFSTTIKSQSLADAIIPRIAANMTQKGLQVIQHYEAQSVPTTISSEALRKVRNKYQCLSELAALGLAVPKTHLIDEKTNLATLFKQEFRFPVILKMEESTHGDGVFLVQKMQELRRLLKVFKRQAPFVLQEFIREAAGSDVRAFVVNGKIVASMKRIAKQGDFRSNLHRGGTAKSIELRPKDQELILAATKAMGMSVAGVDLLQSARGLLLIEVNASPGLEGIEKISGVNVAAAIVNYIGS